MINRGLFAIIWCFFSILIKQNLYAQVIKSVSPDSVLNCKVLDVTISGSNTIFQQGTNLLSFNSAVNSYSVAPISSVFLNDSTINVKVAFNNEAPLGFYNFNISRYLQTQTLTLNNAIYVQENFKKPMLIADTLKTLRQDESIQLYIQGSYTNFTRSNNFIKLINGNSVVSSANVNVINDSVVVANFSFSYFNREGYYSLELRNTVDGLITADSVVLLLQGLKPPKIVSITPSTATQGQSLSVTITGQNTIFQQGTNVLSYSNGSSNLSVSGANFVNDTLIVANVLIPSNASLGYYNFYLGNYLGSYSLSNLNALQVFEGNTTPQIVSCSPNHAVKGDTLDIIVSCVSTQLSGYTNSVYLELNGYTIYATSISVLNNSTLLCRFVFNYFKHPGVYSLKLSNPLSGILTLANSFVLSESNKTPKIKSVAPNYVKMGGVLTVSISGQNTKFEQATNHISLNQDVNSINAANAVFVNDSLIQCSFDFSNSSVNGWQHLNISNYLQYNIGLENAVYVYADDLNGKIVSLQPSSAFLGDSVMLELVSVNTYLAVNDSVWLFDNYGNFIQGTFTDVVSINQLKARFYFSDFCLPGRYSLKVKTLSDSVYYLYDAFNLELKPDGMRLMSVASEILNINYVKLSVKGFNSRFTTSPIQVFLSSGNLRVYADNIEYVNDSLFNAYFSLPNQNAVYDLVVKGDHSALLKRCVDYLANSVENINDDSNVLIYPVPANQFIYVQNKEDGIAQLEIKNCFGQCMLVRQINSVSLIELNDFSAGIYYITININNKTFIRKLIVE